MRPFSSKRSLLFWLLASSLVLPQVASAYGEDPLLAETDSVLESEQIDIDGNFAQKRASRSDRLSKVRRQLEQQNEDMVQTKIEDMRFDAEKKLTKKLKKAFNGGLPVSDQVGTTTAAVQKVETKVEEVKGPEYKNSITPFFGVANIKGELVDFESKISTGVQVEAMVNENFSVGGVFNYITLDVTDLGSSSFVPQSQFFYTPSYFNFYGNEGREMKYNQLSLGVIGKYYIVADSKVRPYVGAGVDYNRTSLKYLDEQNNVQFGQVRLGEEEYNSSYVSGSIMAGTQIIFTDRFGINAEVAYKKGFSSGYDSSTDQGGFFNPDQAALEAIGQDIEESELFMINLGLVIRF
jgi:outer membrane protein W